MIILLLFYLNQRRSGCYALDDRIFNSVLLIGTTVLLLDGVLWLLDGVVYPGGRGILFFLTSASFIINPLIACLWVFYCDLRVHGDERGLIRRAPLYCFPLILNVALVIVNCFIPVAFSINEANQYHREPLFLLYFLVFYVYLVGAIVILMRKWKHYESPAERRDLIFMMLFSVPPILGGIVQGLIYGTSLTWPSTIISFVIVYINVLNRQISTDALTGLNNRRMLKRYLDMETNFAETDSTLFLIMLDMDNFKQINDTYGHAVGDRALTQIADILKSLCGHRNCFLSRLGGDEFTIVGKDHDDQTLNEMLSEIEKRIAEFNASGVEPYQLSVSAGFARFKSVQADTTDALLIAADRSMYSVKAEKKQASQTIAEPEGV
ncbi:MAG: GGDEF domain-containing protein [Eubacteriales bacterium]|nr:GGDEF domain-containing protein [Eubacteriales bacterium]